MFLFHKDRNVEKTKRNFKLTKNLVGSNLNLPHFTSAELLADKFANFFHEQNNNH